MWILAFAAITLVVFGGLAAYAGLAHLVKRARREAVQADPCSHEPALLRRPARLSSIQEPETAAAFLMLQVARAGGASSKLRRGLARAKLAEFEPRCDAHADALLGRLDGLCGRLHGAHCGLDRAIRVMRRNANRAERARLARLLEALSQENSGPTVDQLDILHRYKRGADLV